MKQYGSNPLPSIDFDRSTMFAVKHLSQKPQPFKKPTQLCNKFNQNRTSRTLFTTYEYKLKKPTVHFSNVDTKTIEIDRIDAEIAGSNVTNGIFVHATSNAQVYVSVINGQEWRRSNSIEDCLMYIEPSLQAKLLENAFFSECSTGINSYSTAFKNRSQLKDVSLAGLKKLKTATLQAISASLK